MAVALLNVPEDVENGRRVVDFPQERRIIGRGQGENFRAVLADESEFLGEIDLGFPIANRFRRVGSDALHSEQTHARSCKDGHGRAECLQQTPHTDRPDFWHHVQGDVGLGVGHAACEYRAVARKSIPRFGCSGAFDFSTRRERDFIHEANLGWDFVA